MPAGCSVQRERREGGRLHAGLDSVGGLRGGGGQEARRHPGGRRGGALRQRLEGRLLLEHVAQHRHHPQVPSHVHGLPGGGGALRRPRPLLIPDEPA